MTQTLIDETLINALENPTIFPHSIKQFQRLQTHISWVLLTGEFAYKIKKPVDLGFADFSSLEKRKYYCEQEFALNQKLAPELYLGVLPIYGSPAKPNFEDQGKILEYALKLKQFNQQDKWDHLLNNHQLTSDHIIEAAQIMAQFHLETPVLTSTRIDDHRNEIENEHDYGSLESIVQPMLDNFKDIERLLTLDTITIDTKQTTQAAEQRHRLLTTIKHWSLKEFERLSPYFFQRKLQGFIRECHGDLHLGNIVNYKNKVTIYDRIEFNPQFRWIDTLNDIAFLLMDLEKNHHPQFASLFLNVYMSQTGDFNGIQLLNFYKLYRALVRAKIALVANSHAHSFEAFDTFLHYANDIIHPPQQTPLLMITSGVSGSGKTYASAQIATSLSAIHLRSDLERKRLYSIRDETLYSAEKSLATYQRLYTLADQLLQWGYSVIVDATFLKKQSRDQFRDLASEHQVPFVILETHAPFQELSKRILARQSLKQESDADIAVLEKQLKSVEPLKEDERLYRIIVEEKFDAKKILNHIKNALTTNDPGG